jgi:hypothetical protein
MTRSKSAAAAGSPKATVAASSPTAAGSPKATVAASSPMTRSKSAAAAGSPKATVAASSPTTRIKSAAAAGSPKAAVSASSPTTRSKSAAAAASVSKAAAASVPKAAASVPKAAASVPKAAASVPKATGVPKAKRALKKVYHVRQDDSQRLSNRYRTILYRDRDQIEGLLSEKLNNGGNRYEIRINVKGSTGDMYINVYDRKHSEQVAHLSMHKHDPNGRSTASHVKKDGIKNGFHQNPTVHFGETPGGSITVADQTMLQDDQGPRHPSTAQILSNAALELFLVL